MMLHGTHRWDSEEDRIVQVVTPAELRQRLEASGALDFEPPPFFGVEDEWQVEGALHHSILPPRPAREPE